jgi:hypothetical protein
MFNTEHVTLRSRKEEKLDQGTPGERQQGYDGMQAGMRFQAQTADPHTSAPTKRAAMWASTGFYRPFPNWSALSWESLVLKHLAVKTLSIKLYG